LASKATAFDEVAQNNFHYAVQGHLGWPLSLPIKSQNA